MNTLMITQPMYLPWRGIFEQINLCDVFLYYDDVKWSKGSFESRVQIKTPDGWKWLSAPIDKSSGSHILIKDIKFAQNDWRKTHLEILRLNYRKALFFDMVWSELIEKIYSFKTDYLSEFNINSMLSIFEYMGINKKFYISSELSIATELKKSERVLAICKYFAATVYLTGWGARNYIDHVEFEKNQIEIKYMDYNLNEYSQLNGTFNPYVSIVDLLFNIGPNCLQYFKSTTVNWRDFLEKQNKD